MVRQGKSTLDWKALAGLVGIGSAFIALGVAYGQININTMAIADIQNWQRAVIDTLGRVDERTKRIEIILNQHTEK